MQYEARIASGVRADSARESASARDRTHLSLCSTLQESCGPNVIKQADVSVANVEPRYD